MSTNKFKVFVDFDGTITRQDVGEAIFREFGDAIKTDLIVTDLLADKITARKCWELLFATIDQIDVIKLDEFINQIEIDSTFHRFHEYCIENEIEMFVLSDGFDYYINRIFKRENLNHVKIFANNLTIDNKNRLVPSFPYFDVECQTSANCKRNHILNNSGDEEFTIYIDKPKSRKQLIQEWKDEFGEEPELIDGFMNGEELWCPVECPTLPNGKKITPDCY